tara:strand:+ start:1619 stop:1774 length:156 start_codon:yes stop_codon:yes gene_type:complete
MKDQCDSCENKEMYKFQDFVPNNPKLIEISLVCKGCGVFQSNRTYYTKKKG